MPYSMSNKIIKAGVQSADQLPAKAKREIYFSMLRRALILVVLGIIVNGGLKFNGYEIPVLPVYLAA